MRVSNSDAKALDGFEEFCKYSPLPVVADIHFDYKLALEAQSSAAAVTQEALVLWAHVDAVRQLKRRIFQ